MRPKLDRRAACAAALAALGLLFASGPAQPAGEPKLPDIVDVKVRAAGPGRFDFDVTVSSPYDTPARYADAFRVRNRDGTVYGERILLHDHQTEQPFTRDLTGVAIPAGVSGVVVEGRDQKEWLGR